MLWIRRKLPSLWQRVSASSDPYGLGELVLPLQCPLLWLFIPASFDTHLCFETSFVCHSVLFNGTAVRSFGTEDRAVPKHIPPRNETYEFIIFRGSDIKDLHVSEIPKQGEAPQDPAILSAVRRPSVCAFVHVSEFFVSCKFHFVAPPV